MHVSLDRVINTSSAVVPHALGLFVSVVVSTVLLHGGGGGLVASWLKWGGGGGGEEEDPPSMSDSEWNVWVEGGGWGAAGKVAVVG